MKLTSDRLTGMVAGVFGIRAFDVGLSSFGQLVLPVGELSDRLQIAAPSITGAVISGYLCFVYLRSMQVRWQHISAIVLLALGMVYGAFMSVIPLVVEMPNVGVAGPMVARGIVAMLFCGVTIAMIVRIMKIGKGDQAAEPGATDNPDDAQRSREDH